MSIYQIQTSGLEKRSIYIALVLGVFGYIASTFTCEDVFPRFGALIVCSGIFFGMKGITTNLDYTTPVFESRLEKLKSDMEFTLSELGKVAPKEEVEKFRSKIDSEVEEGKLKVQRTSYSLKQRILKLEGSIIIAGTLIWAFGDYLVLDAYLKCKT